MVAFPRGCANVVHGSFASDVYFAEAKHDRLGSGSRVFMKRLFERKNAG
jgi:hypothetical protein